MTPDCHGHEIPMVTIFAESGALAGDLAAFLAGRFAVQQVTSRAAAAATLAVGCRALLIVDAGPAEWGTGEVDLVRHALAVRCRVLVLGSGGLDLDLDPDLATQVVRLPSRPSPQQVFRGLVGLEPGMQAES